MGKNYSRQKDKWNMGEAWVSKKGKEVEDGGEKMGMSTIKHIFFNYVLIVPNILYVAFEKKEKKSEYSVGSGQDKLI